MNIELFILFLAISFILIFLGFYSNIKALALVGLVGLFLLGMLLQSGHVTQSNGYIEINHPACSECGGDRIPLYRNTTIEYDNYTTTEINTTNPDNRTENITINVTVNNPYNITTTEFIGYENVNGTGNYTYIASTEVHTEYESIKDTTSKWFGRWLAIVSVLAFVLVIVSNKKTGV